MPIVEIELRSWKHLRAAMTAEFKFPEIDFLTQKGVTTNIHRPLTIQAGDIELLDALQEKYRRLHDDRLVRKYLRLEWTEHTYRIDRKVLGIRLETNEASDLTRDEHNVNADIFVAATLQSLHLIAEPYRPELLEH